MRILLIEDNPGDIRLLQEYLKEGGAGPFQVTPVDRLSRALERLVAARFDAVLLDLALPDSQGLDTLVQVHEAAMDVPIVVLTGIDDEALGVRLIQAGAQDYLVKGQVTGPLLTRSLRYAAERKRAAGKLAESEARFRAILEYSPGLVFLKDLEGRYLQVNRQFQQTFHLTRDQVVGKTDEDLFSSEQAAAFHANDRKVFQAGVPLQFEETALHDDGPHTSLVLKFLLRDGVGTPYALCGMTTDITERKRDEEVRGRLAAIVECSSDAMISVAHGCITSWNPAAERLLGYSAEEILGKPMTLLIPPTRTGEAEHILERVLQGERVNDVETQRVRKDGRSVTVSLSVFPVTDIVGRVIGASAIVRDLTERKRAEAERRKLVEARMLLLESTGEGIYGVDLDGRFTFVNKAAARMLGYQPSELVGKKSHDLIHHSRPDGSCYRSEECPIYQSFRSGEGCRVDDEVLWRKDGTAFPSQYSSVPMMEQDTVIGAVVVFTDITDRKYAEEELQRSFSQVRTLSRRLEAVREEERTRIARELHDELGVRLTCLKMDISRLPSFLKGASLSKLQEKMLAMSEQVDTTIVALQELVTELRPGVLDDLGLVAAIDWQCRDFERRSGIRCVCDCEEEEIPLDGARATAAFRICQEALTNVVRHAGAKEIRVCLEKVDSQLLLQIHDDGQGIQPENITAATSLGLLGMRERAAAVEGVLQIVSSPGQGTTVTLRLSCD